MSSKTRTGQRQGRPVPPARSAGTPSAARQARLAARRQAQHRAALRRLALKAGVIAAGAAVIIGVLFAIFQNSSSSSSTAGAYPYQVGSPGPGQAAPGFTLASSTGGSISLSAYRGKTVLLFFQEGLTCQPCWNQIADLQKNAAQLRVAGIDQVVSVTTDPIGAITQKTRDMGLSIPVLSDPDLAVSRAYHANSYGMMGTSRDGHTFILIGPHGTIRWRADYGGPPKYVMYLPASALLADIKAGEHPS